MIDMEVGTSSSLSANAWEFGTRTHEPFYAAEVPSSRCPTVLVVDDDETIRELTAAILQSEGYTVYTAANGARGLCVFREQSIDVLITDVEMARLDGRALAGHVRRMRPNLPILFMTGGVGVSDTEWTAPGGLNGFIGKPFSFAALLDQVEKLMARSDAPERPALALS